MTKVYVLMQRDMDDEDKYDIVSIHATLDGATKDKEESEKDEFIMEIYDNETPFKIETYLLR